MCANANQLGGQGMCCSDYGNMICPTKDFFASDYQSKVRASNFLILILELILYHFSSSSQAESSHFRALPHK